MHCALKGIMKHTYNSLSKLTPAALKRTILRAAVKTNDTSAERSMIIGRVRYIGRTIDDLIQKVTEFATAEMNPQISFISAGNEPVEWPVRGQGRRIRITSDQVQQVCEKKRQAKATVYNGCTGRWLAEHFGTVIFHEQGRGWFYYGKAA